MSADIEQKIYGFTRGKIEQLDVPTSWARSMLAKLRQGAGKHPGAVPGVLEVTIGGLPDEAAGKYGAASFAEYATYTALTLYAIHRQGNISPVHQDRGLSLGGGASKFIALDRGRETAVRRRFDAVVSSRDMTELAQHARGLVQLLRTSGTPIKLDYAQLAVDLYRYQPETGADGIRLKWSRDFYRFMGHYDDEDNTAETVTAYAETEV